MISFNDQSSIAEDDRNGMRHLYGAFDLPFPVEGKYALSAGDAVAIANSIYSVKISLPTKTSWHKAIANGNSTLMSPWQDQSDIDKMVQDDFLKGTTHFRSTRVDRSTFLDEQRSLAKGFRDIILREIPSYSNEFLLSLRRGLTSALAINIIYNKNNDGQDLTPQEFLDISRNTLNTIRNSAIDELFTRGVQDE